MNASTAPRPTRHPSMQARARSSALALTLCAAWPQASQAQDYENEMRQIRAYGEVSIAQDSTKSWGPWDQFEAPAAGPQAGALKLSTSPQGATQQYRLLPILLSSSDCLASSECGYAVVTTLAADGSLLSQHAARVGVLGGDGESGQAPLVVEQSPIVKGPALIQSTGLLSFVEAQMYANDPETASTMAHLTPADTDSGAPAPARALTLVQYVQGSDGSQQISQIAGGFVGPTTSAADLNSLRASRAQASYAGQDSAGNQWVQNVNFGRGTFSATVNGGRDILATQDDGRLQASQIGFQASGVVRGSSFQSTSITALDTPTISGSVVGSFVGPRAAGSIGVADVNKSVAPSSSLVGYSNTRSITAFGLSKTP